MSVRGAAWAIAALMPLSAGCADRRDDAPPRSVVVGTWVVDERATLAAAGLSSREGLVERLAPEPGLAREAWQKGLDESLAGGREMHVAADGAARYVRVAGDGTESTTAEGTWTLQGRTLSVDMQSVTPPSPPGRPSGHAVTNYEIGRDGILRQLKGARVPFECVYRRR